MTWTISQNRFDPDPALESVFAVGNGYRHQVIKQTDGDVRFSPRLPAQWTRLRFRVQVRGQLVEVDMTPYGTTYELLEGRGLPVQHFGEQLRILPGRPVYRPAAFELPEAA